MDEDLGEEVDALVRALSVRSAPAYAGELAQVLAWDIDRLGQVAERAIEMERIYRSAEGRLGLLEGVSPDEREADLEETLRARWQRLRDLREGAFERLAQTQRVGMGLVFDDGAQIAPNRVLTRLVGDWASPERWFRQLREQKRFPAEKGCPVCDEPERVGDILVEIEAPNGHEKSYAVTFHGHCHGEHEGGDHEQPALLIGVRLHEDRLPSPAAQPVMSGSASDTGLSAVASYSSWGRMNEEDGPGAASLDRLSEAVEEIRTRMQAATDYAESQTEASKLAKNLSELVRNINRVRSRVDYLRHSRRLASTLQTLKSIFRSTWTFERIGERTVGALASMIDADQIVLLIHKSGDTFELLGQSSEGAALPDEISMADSELLRSLVEAGEAVRIADVTEATDAEYDPLAGGRSWLGVPTKNGDSTVGALVLWDREEAHFTRPDEELIGALSNVVGEALANVGESQSTHPRSGIDEVTGVFNEDQFYENASREFVRARSEETALSAIVFEIDGWERISSGTGGSEADDMLRAVVDRATDALRESDFVGRYGQATFAALLIDVDEAIAERVAERIRRAVGEEEFELADASIPATVSVGASTLTEAVRSINGLLDRADSAMLRASERGGDGVELAHVVDGSEDSD